MLARRDRASVGAARKHWNGAPLDSQAPLGWRNLSGGRTCKLLGNFARAETVHGFLAALAEQARSSSWGPFQLDPPQRASRYFRFHGRLRSIQPDAFRVLHCDGRDHPFSLERERRAVRPYAMATRIAPDLRYYSSKRPLQDHGALPLVLVVSEGRLAAGYFLRIAQERSHCTGVNPPLLVSARQLLAQCGPLGPAWTMSGDLHAHHAFDCGPSTLT